MSIMDSSSVAPPLPQQSGEGPRIRRPRALTESERARFRLQALQAEHARPFPRRLLSGLLRRIGLIIALMEVRLRG